MLKLNAAKHAAFAVRVKELPRAMSLIHDRLLPRLDIRGGCKSSHAPVELQIARRPSAKNAILDSSLVIQPLAFVHVAIGMDKSPTSWA